MDRAEKQAEIDLLSERLKGAALAVCADYRGLTVAQITGLRKALGQSGAQARVVKNTLAKIALKKAYGRDDEGEVAKFSEIFDGPNFLIVAKDDPVSSAKVLVRFEKELEHFSIKGGWFEGRFLDKPGVAAFADMASREETLAKLLCLIATPATQFLRILQAPARQLVGVLNACRDKLEKNAG